MKTIYIGEDFPPQVRFLNAILGEKEDYTTKIFMDGLEFYQNTQEAPPDLIILDIILPSLSGLAITRLLKYNNKYKKIPIIVTSSIIESDIKERALKAGADIFIHKPFKPQELLQEVDNLLYQ